MPVLAHLFTIAKDRRFSPEVLPVVCVNTHISFMIIFAVGTPNCFEVKDIEVHIGLKFFYKLNWQLLFLVSEGAKLSVLAFLLPVKIRRAKLSLVLVRVIEFLNSIMSFLALITIWAFLVIVYVPALLWLVESQRSSPIFLIIMIHWAFLQVVP